MIGLILGFSLATSSLHGGPTALEMTDTNLNAAYEALSAHLDRGGRNRLRSKERAWITQRNRACGFEANNPCAARWAIRRTTELEGMLTANRSYFAMNDKGLLTLESRLDDACRSPSQDSAGPVCSRRDAVVKLLEHRGWCYGPDGAIGADERWMRAGPRCHSD